MAELRFGIVPQHLYWTSSEFRQVMHDAMTVIGELFSGELAVATPEGRSGLMQDAWARNSVDVTNTQIVYTTENLQPYSGFVLHGTGPARGNPGRYLIPWVEKKFNLEGKAAVSVAYAIGRKLMRRGRKGRDLLSPILASEGPHYAQDLCDAAIRWLNSHGGGKGAA